MSIASPKVVVDAVVLYFYNVSPARQIAALFGDVHPSYAEEWVRRYRAGFTTWWGALDTPNREKYVRLALERYGPEAIKADRRRTG